MRAAGYTYRPKDKDFIREDGVLGRFHAKVLEKGIAYNIHYDLNLDGRHVSPRSPMHHSMERIRILKRLHRFKQYDMQPKEFQKLMERYVV